MRAQDNARVGVCAAKMITSKCGLRYRPRLAGGMMPFMRRYSTICP